MIVYKGLFPYREKFSGSSAIIYSTLVSHSLWEYGEVFDGQGCFDLDKTKLYLDVCKDKDGYSFIDLPYFTCSTLTTTLGMSERNVRYSLKDLREKKILTDDSICCPLWLIKGGYVKIVKGTMLKGWQLIFYSLLKERADYFGGQIDTWAYKLAEQFSTTTNNIYVLINILKSKGYVSRTKNNKLLVK